MPVLAQRIRRTPMGTVYGADMAHPLLFSGADNTVTVYDFSARDRFGLKGRGAHDWLVSQGYVPPDSVNATLRQVRGVDIMRLGNEDFLFVNSAHADNSPLDDLRMRWLESTQERKGYNAYRDETWGWFYLSGRHVAAFMAQTCPVDLSETQFALNAVAQTRVAQMDCVLVRSDRSEMCGFDVFFDVASTEFLRKSLAALLDINDNTLI